jgi:hypothetical protein
MTAQAPSGALVPRMSHAALLPRQPGSPALPEAIKPPLGGLGCYVARA